MWPKLLMILYLMLGLCIEISQHGKPKEGIYNVQHYVIGATIITLILWWGGFWN